MTRRALNTRHTLQTYRRQGKGQLDALQQVQVLVEPVQLRCIAAVQERHRQGRHDGDRTRDGDAVPGGDLRADVWAVWNMAGV